MGLDKEVERFIKFWQEERNCVILISRQGAGTYMDVLYRESGKVDKGIYLGSRNATKEWIMIQARNYFKGQGA